MKKQKNKESLSLRFLYGTFFGRLILRLLTARWVSKLVGAYLDSRLSKPLIRRFVRKNGIDLSEYYSDDFKCFNDCFTRKIKEGLRPIDGTPSTLIAPCDGLLSAYEITPDARFSVKGREYTVESLLNDRELAEKYFGGVCLVFRLCVNHYHRYVYVDNASKGDNVFIKGRLHTVRPIALEKTPVFKENCREYTVMQTENFGAVTQIEVGALLVGKIKNHHTLADVKRGEEKGMFLYGGSTVILLLEKGAAAIREELFTATEGGEETPVRMGERLGTKEKG